MADARGRVGGQSSREPCPVCPQSWHRLPGALGISRGTGVSLLVRFPRRQDAGCPRQGPSRWLEGGKVRSVTWPRMCNQLCYLMKRCKNAGHRGSVAPPAGEHGAGPVSPDSRGEGRHLSRVYTLWGNRHPHPRAPVSSVRHSSDLRLDGVVGNPRLVASWTEVQGTWGLHEQLTPDTGPGGEGPLISLWGKELLTRGV